ncbi:MAG: ABC transporter substrate-binding protein [Gammaproteobacteria bacterium]|nr:ABC transporter substrate-binding protein [Gammaproteobacteria bacterium]
MFISLLLVACGGDSGQSDDFVSIDNTQEVLDFYAANPELITFATIADLPTDLMWEDGLDQPEIGSPQATKGGTFYELLDDFPPTLRTVGPDSNSSSRGWISGYYGLTYASQHPDTNEFIPGIAESWAIDAAHKTVYIKINPAARWTDGEPITSDDALFSFFFYYSDHIQAPFSTNYYKTEFTNITRYDDYTFSMTVPKVKPDMTSRVLQVVPVPQHFYKELGEDFPERYQWRYQPHAGAYFIDADEINMGVNLVIERLQDWWAKDNKYYRYRFNTDRIVLNVVRDPAKRYEAFRRGDADIMRISTAEQWYDNLPDDDPDITAGYIHKNTFYNQGPRSNWGLWINSARRFLDNQDVRLGIQYAANWDLVIKNYFRGDPVRLKTQNDGYPEFSHPTLTARPFDINLAIEHFAKAGFVERGSDGILVNAQGDRLAFTLSTMYDRYTDVFTILKEEAIKSGLELRIEMMDGASGFRKALEKQHEIFFVSFAASNEMYPRMWEYFHSINAYDQAFLEDGSVNPDRKTKPQTNNLQSIASLEMDAMVDEYQDSDDKERMIELSHQILQLHHDYGSFSPGWVEPYYRTAYWRWVRWPEGFNYRYTIYPYEAFVHWIDEDMKQDTEAAQREDRTFPASIEVYDQYR